MLSIPSRDPSSWLAWGPTSHPGTPLGQWVLSRRQRQRPGTSCSSQPAPCLPHHHSTPLSTNCRVASSQLRPRPQAGASQWIKGSLESLPALHQPHRPSCTGVVSMVLRLPSPALGGGQEGCKHEAFLSLSHFPGSPHVREAHPGPSAPTHELAMGFSEWEGICCQCRRRGFNP